MIVVVFTRFVLFRPTPFSFFLNLVNAITVFLLLPFTHFTCAQYISQINSLLAIVTHVMSSNENENADVIKVQKKKIIEALEMWQRCFQTWRIKKRG